MQRQIEHYIDIIRDGLNEQNIDFVDDVIFKQGSLPASRIRAVSKILPILNSENKEFVKELICNGNGSLQFVEDIVESCDTEEKLDFIRDLMGSGITDYCDFGGISSNFEQNFESMKNVYAELNSLVESLTDIDECFGIQIQMI